MRGDLISSAGFSDLAFNTIMTQTIELSLSRTVFIWDCAAVQGRPDPRRASIRPSSVVTFALPGRQGGIDRAETEAMRDEILDLAGLADTRALVAALNTAVPPPRFQIDYTELADPFLIGHSFRISASVRYLSCLYRPRGGKTGDHFIVFVPFRATFTTTITGRCSGVMEDGFDVTSLSPHVEAEPSLATLEAEVSRDQEETQRRMLEETLESLNEPPHLRPLDPDDPYNPFNEYEEDQDDSSDEDEDQDEQEDESDDQKSKKRKSRGNKKPG